MNREKIKNPSALPLKPGQVLILEQAGQKELDTNVFFRYKDLLSSIGYNLLYIPYLINAISIDTIKYYVPGFDRNTSMDDIQSGILTALGLEINSPVAILKVDGDLMVIRSESNDASTEALLYELCVELRKPFFVESLSRQLNNVGIVRNTVCGATASPLHHLLNMWKHETNGAPTDQMLDWMGNKTEAELKDFGITEELLRSWLEPANSELSHIRVDKYGKIILEDFGNLEISLDTKCKALYLLYLKHPEGIAIKELCDYEEELFDLYCSISHRDDLVAQRAAVHNLCDPLKKDINPCLSRIKKEFISKICESKALYYYIDGQSGGKRSILLLRDHADKLIQETIRPS